MQKNIEFEFTKSFLKDLGKLNKSIAIRLKSRIKLFEIDQTHPKLNNHKLKGKLKGQFSINITGDIRAIYRIENDNTIKFLRLGSHSKLY